MRAEQLNAAGKTWANYGGFAFAHYADPLMHANPKKSTDFLADAFALADAYDLTQSPNPKPVLPKLAALGGKSG